MIQEILTSFGLPLVAVGLLLAALSAFVAFARNYRKCPPNRVLVVYGRKHKARGEAEARGYRLITGGSAFVLPLLEDYTYIGLDTFSVESSVTDTPNKDGVPVTVEATANIKVSSDPERLAAAVERMLGKTTQEIHNLLKTTLDGLLRQIIGTLTVEDIVRNREKLAQEVLSGAQTELNKLGFQIDVFVVNKVDDKEGYIKALGARRTAEVKRDAEIAKAEADRESVVKSSAAKQEAETARLAADERIAQANRDLDLKKAAFKKETETAQADADMAKSLKDAEIDRELRQRRVAAEEAETKARIALAEQESQRRERELVATTIKPAEANARSAIVVAEGNAASAVRQADAVRSQAEAEKQKLTLEGEGRAAAEAARTRQLGEAEGAAAAARGRAEGEAIKAKLLAEAEGLTARGKAEGEAIKAKLLAEAEGLTAKNEALAHMSDAARLIIVLEHLPHIIDRLGEAGQKVVGSAFEHIGAGMSRIDSIHIVDLGGGNGANGSDPLSKFALNIPKTVFGVMSQAKAMGLDFNAVLQKMGIPDGAFEGLLKGMGNAGNSAGAEVRPGDSYAEPRA
jgi:flotillin